MKIILNPNSKDTSLSEAYLHLSAELNNENPKKALEYINRSLQIFSTYSNEFQYRRYVRKAQIFKILGELDSSVYYCNLVLSKSLANQKHEFTSWVYSELGGISTSQGNFNKAIDYFRKQEQIIKEHHLKEHVSGIYNNLGIAYGSKGDWDMAMEFFRRSTQYDLLNKIEGNLGSDFNNIGVVWMIREQPDSAAKYFAKGLEYRIKNNDMLGIGGSLNNLALMSLGKKDYTRCKLLLDSAYRIAENNGFKKLQLEVLESYTNLYASKGDFKTAFDYQKKTHATEKKFHTEESNSKIQTLEGDIAIQQKQAELLQKDLALTKLDKEKQRQKSVILAGTVFLLGALLFLYNFIKSNRTLRERNQLINEQKLTIEEKHKDITDSISYARKIQSALIISEEKLRSGIGPSFVIFKPRDIVSGDFYWYSEHSGSKIIALADCTGHGVPGAFMSMIGITLLNKIVNERGITSPGKILDELKHDVIKALHLNDDGTGKRDGMDMAIVSISNNTLTYAGANSKCYVYTGEQVQELNPDKQPIGLSDRNELYTETKVPITDNMRLFMFTDGVVDQFGGPDGKKAKAKTLRKWLEESVDLDLITQGKEIEKAIESWKKGHEQTDDISLIGIKLG